MNTEIFLNSKVVNQFMDKCPYCERTFDGILDFPIVHIDSVKRIALPEIITDNDNLLLEVKVKKGYLWKKMIDNPEIPPNVFEQLRNSGKDRCRYDGFVYQVSPTSYHLGERNFIIRCFDFTENLHRALITKEMRETLGTLEDLVGKDVATADLRKLPGFENKIVVDCMSGFSLNFTNSDKDDVNHLGCCKLAIIGLDELNYVFCDDINIAEIKYEGRVKRDLS